MTAGLARRWLVAVATILLTFAVLAASASAASVAVRIDAATGPLARASVTLPTTPVAPAGALDGQTCPGNSIVGAVHAATTGDWSGTWSDTTGWSIEKIKTATAAVADGRKFLTLVNGNLINDPPCQATLKADDALAIYPACLTAKTSCFSQGTLGASAPVISGPGSPIRVHVVQTAITLDSNGNGYGAPHPSLGASVVGPENSDTTDTYYGTGDATVSVKARGDATIRVSKTGFVPDTVHVCVTDGADGYCGTELPPQVPFDPYAFCQTTGNDGYCNSPDQVAPLGRITAPAQAATFIKNAGPTKLTGTVDFDPSLTDHVNLRLMRRLTVTVKKYKKKKVWVTRKVHGKKVRKRITKRKAYKVKQTRCSAWNDTTAEFKALKKCDPATGTQWLAEGAEVWHYEFLSKLPTGTYTLDVLATDGAGNVDSTPELGRNRVTFKVN